jgi:hypothetical protein
MTQANRRARGGRGSGLGRVDDLLADDLRQHSIVYHSEWLAQEPELSSLVFDPDRMAEAFVARLQAGGRTLDELDGMSLGDRSEIILRHTAEVAASEVTDDEISTIARALEGVVTRLAVEGERDGSVATGLVCAFLSRPENAGLRQQTGVVRQVVLWSIMDGLGIIDPDGEDEDVDAMVGVLDDMLYSLIEGELIIGIYTDAELAIAKGRVDEALAKAGLPLVGTMAERDQVMEERIPWIKAASMAIQSYLDGLMTPEWNADVARYLLGLVEGEEILDQDWEIGVHFMGTVLATDDPTEVSGLLNAALLGELILWDDERQGTA